MTANISRETRKEVYQRDGWRCALCDCTQYIQIHHVIPRGQGGALDSPHNLITLCSKCHGQAHGTDLVPGITEADMAQMCVEYLADLYAFEGWHPWRSGYCP